MTPRSKRFFLIGFVLVFIGFLVPLLMVVRIIPSGFVLGFASYGASVSGMVLGLIAALEIYAQRRARGDRP
jgi:hypothetical protein